MSLQLSASRLSRLIGLIYDCAVDPQRWEIALDAIRHELDFQSALLSAISFHPVHLQLNTTSGVPADWVPRLQSYAGAAMETYGGPQRILQFPLEEPIVQSQVVDPATLTDNAWYRDYLVPQGLIDSATVFVIRDAGMGASIGFAKHRLQGAFSEPDLVGLRLLAPHFRRAISISRLLDLGTVVATSFARTLDALSCGILLVDEHLGAVHANSVAEQMFVAGDLVRLTANRISFVPPGANDALKAAVAQCARAEHDLGRRGIGVPLKRQSGEACVAHVLPLRVGEIRPGLHGNAAAAIFIAPALAPPQLPGDALALLYDLTPAETRVFESIAAGEAPAEIASRLGIAVATVKTHLVRVFHKTGCNRQLDLVKLAGSLAMPY
jgi:DNA-binding CsgD family transcriptional regulator